MLASKSGSRDRFVAGRLWVGASCVDDHHMLRLGVSEAVLGSAAADTRRPERVSLLQNTRGNTFAATSSILGTEKFPKK